MRFLAFLWFGMSALAFGLVHFPATTAILCGIAFAGWLARIFFLEIRAQVKNHQRKDKQKNG